MNIILKNLKEADYSIQKANHLLKITFPLLNHKKILLRVVEEIKNSLIKEIIAILYYEHIIKNIKISKKPKNNFKIFKKKLAKKYKIGKEQIKKIEEIFRISQIQKNSPVHILKEERLIFLSKDSKQKSVTKKDLENYLIIAKNLLTTIKNNLITETPIKE